MSVSVSLSQKYLSLYSKKVEFHSEFLSLLYTDRYSGRNTLPLTYKIPILSLALSLSYNGHKAPVNVSRGDFYNRVKRGDIYSGHTDNGKKPLNSGHKTLSASQSQWAYTHLLWTNYIGHKTLTLSLFSHLLLHVEYVVVVDGQTHL